MKLKLSILTVFAIANVFWGVHSAHADPQPGDPPEIVRSSSTIHVTIPPDWAQPK